jgi:hypothetical protein
MARNPTHSWGLVTSVARNHKQNTGRGDTHGPELCKSKRLGDIHGPRPHKFAMGEDPEPCAETQKHKVWGVAAPQTICICARFQKVGVSAAQKCRPTRRADVAGQSCIQSKKILYKYVAEEVREDEYLITSPEKTKLAHTPYSY